MFRIPLKFLPQSLLKAIIAVSTSFAILQSKLIDILQKNHQNCSII